MVFGGTMSGSSSRTLSKLKIHLLREPARLLLSRQYAHRPAARLSSGQPLHALYVLCSYIQYQFSLSLRATAALLYCRFRFVALSCPVPICIGTVATGQCCLARGERTRLVCDVWCDAGCGESSLIQITCVVFHAVLHSARSLSLWCFFGGEIK